MRLEQLDVTGFGRLAGIDVAFHPHVTVVIGNNESGKSTVQRAVRAALFGLDAGGQGRAVERSEWSRWKPWNGARYGLALTYRLDDGRRVRVARSFDTREQNVQVLELGGRDITDDLRSGRTVVPGRFHLGVDEPVFCATAWLGEDGLRLASGDAAPQRAAELQEAIERIADAGGGATAAQALTRLRQALDRVGSERRLGSPLGVATVRVRELDQLLVAARARLASVVQEQERLRELEARAVHAEERRLEAERAWLTGRLAELAHRIAQLEGALVEADDLAGVVAATQGFAGFSAGDEDRVIALGAELNQATLAAAEAHKRWEASAPHRETVSKRRAEITAGLRALAPLASGVNVDEQRVRELQADLGAAAASWARLDTSALVQERRAALRREIAATGFGDLPAASLEAITPLLDSPPAARSPRWAWPALAGVAATMALGLWLALAHRGAAAAGVILSSLLAAVLMVAGLRAAAGRRRDGRSRRMATLRELRISPDELGRLGERLPSLRALQAALIREEALVESRRLDGEALHREASALHARCVAAAAACGIPARAELEGPGATDEYLDAARELLGRIEAILNAQQRRAELIAEDRQLAMTELALDQVQQELGRTRAAVSGSTEKLHRILSAAGLARVATPAEGVAAFRDACAARRRHDDANRAHDEVQRRVSALGADPLALRRSWDEFAAALRERGGDPDAARHSSPLDAASLRRLEIEAEHAQREASASTAEAGVLRARLSTLLDSVPDVADLEDERMACAGARERAQHQVAALQRAADLIETATRGAHRDLAPRLAESLQSRLSLLTDSRYSQVNVDTDHFAVSLLCDDRPDFVPLELASQGTRDQVSLLLRLALSEVLGGSGECAPLLLDEPLLSADPARRHTLLEFLHRLTEAHQVVLTTSDPTLAAEMHDVSGGDCSIVHLGGEATLEATGRLLGQSSPAMRTSPSSSDTSSVKRGMRATGTLPKRSSLAS